MLRVGSHHGKEGEREEHEDQENLAAAEVEFGLSVILDSEDVEQTREIFSFQSFIKVIVGVGALE
jgi:hypothetical protein